MNILEQAAKAVEDRHETYAHPSVNFQRIAVFWNVVLMDKLKPGQQITSIEVAQMQRLIKEARLVETPEHQDSLIDICGYAYCQEEIIRPQDDGAERLAAKFAPPPHRGGTPAQSAADAVDEALKKVSQLDDKLPSKPRSQSA